MEGESEEETEEKNTHSEGKESERKPVIVSLHKYQSVPDNCPTLSLADKTRSNLKGFALKVISSGHFQPAGENKVPSTINYPHQL